MSTNIFRSGVHYVASYWWTWILRGVIAFLFGLAIFTRPVVSTSVLVLLFGAFALAGGMLALIAGLSTIGQGKYWWAIIIEGFIGIAIGFLTFFIPGITALALLVVIAIWAILTGVFAIIGAISGDTESKHRWLQGFSGLISIILGLILLASPAVGILAVVWVLGIYAMIYGISQIVEGIRLNRLEHLIHSTQ